MLKLQFKENPSRSFWLVDEKITLGSDPSNTLVLDGLGIDEFHAEIIIEPNRLILKSKPGTCIVNDLPVGGEQLLQANDELRIGKERLVIVDPKNPPKQPKRPSPVQKQPEAADWQLVPDHEKLKTMDFSIRERVVLGRAKECQFSVPYKLLSREHAELWLDNGELFLKDLGSANGCFVNGKRVVESKLANGDKVAFARLTFTVKGKEGSSQRQPAKVAGNSEEELNRTMIRPAIDFDTDLLVKENASGASDMQLELESSPNGEGNSHQGDGESGKSASGRSQVGKIVGLIVALVVAAMVAWRFAGR